MNRLTSLPLIKIKDGDDIHLLRGGVHDLFILDKDGSIHYFNTQGMYSTKYKEVEFVANYDEDWAFKIFDKANFLDLMEIDAKDLGIDQDEDYLELKESIEDCFNKANEKLNAKFIEAVLKDFEEAFKDEN